MKAITLTQPWAMLVALGAKKIETRSWSTKYRGLLAIHAAKGFGYMNRPDVIALLNTEPFKSALAGSGFETIDLLPRACIVATCNLSAVVSTNEIGHIPLTDNERAFGDYSRNRYAWMLSDIKPLPIAYSARGALGLWDWKQ